MTEFLSNVTSTCHSSIFICRHSRAVDLSPMTCAINKQPTNSLHRNAPRPSFSLTLYTIGLCCSSTFPRALGCASVWLNKQHGAQKYIFPGHSLSKHIKPLSDFGVVCSPMNCSPVRRRIYKISTSCWALRVDCQGQNPNTHNSNMHKLLESKIIALENKRSY